MRSKIMVAIAEIWLPVIGAGIFIAWAIGAWYGGDKRLAIWLIFSGSVCMLLLGTLQWQRAIAEVSNPDDAEVKKARAYVFIDTIKTQNIDDNIQANAPHLIAHILVVVKNTGQTPAFKFTHQAAIRLAAWPPPDDLFKLSQTPPISSDTLPSGNFSQITVSLGRPLSVDDKTTLGLGIQAVYLFGLIRYEDVFGIKRCARYRYRVGGDVGFNGTAMAPMPEGNEVDQHCD
jgi:hypothetical protein